MNEQSILSVLLFSGLGAVTLAQPPNGGRNALYQRQSCGGFREFTPEELEQMQHAGVCTSGWDFSTIRDTGPSQNRYDLVVVGDGWVDDSGPPADNLAVYAARTEAHINRLLLTHPYPEYAHYLNVHRVDVISTDPCIDYPPTGLECDTALDFSYGDDGFVPVRCILGNFSKICDAAGCAPDYEAILGLANSNIHGGCATGNIGHVAAKASTGIHTTVHELGHALGKLADEYVIYGAQTYPSSTDPTFRNVSIFTASEQLAMEEKWHRWLGEQDVDTYEGAFYYAFGIYRSTVFSVMSTTSNFNFGPVNSEGIIIEIYKNVSPIDSTIPPALSDVLYSASTVFEVDVLQPSSADTVEVQWFFEGVPVAGANGAKFQIPNPGSLADGAYEVSVRAIDQTPLVRDEEARDRYMTATEKWWVGVGDGCVSNDDCDRIELFCKKEEGDCDGGGLCQLRPEGCPENLAPICACDGMEYSNECLANAAGTSVAVSEACPCYSNDDCNEFQFCLKADCRPERPGECMISPNGCFQVYDPVCGCDGMEYSNKCQAHMARVNVSPSPQPCSE